MRRLPVGILLGGAAGAVLAALLWSGSGPTAPTGTAPDRASAPAPAAPVVTAHAPDSPGAVAPGESPTVTDAAPAVAADVGAQAAPPAGPVAVERPTCPAETPAILRAIDTRDPAEVRRAIAARADVNACVDMGEGGVVYALPEAIAAERAPFQMAHLLLEAGADPDRVAPGNSLPLEMAILEGAPDLVAALIAAGAEVNAVSGGAPLITAAATAGDLAILRLLLDAGADPDTPFMGDRPLHIVASAPSPEYVAALIEAGADLNARSRIGDNALAIAARWGRLETVRDLLDAGTRDLGPALAVAREGGHAEIVALLEERLAGRTGS